MRLRHSFIRILGLVLLALLVLRAVATVPLLRSTLASPFLETKDIAQEYLLAVAVRQGGPMYLPLWEMRLHYGLPEAPSHGNPTPHPPSVGLLFLPLTLLDFRAAARAWFAMELVFLAGAVWALFKIAGTRPRAARVGLASLALIGLDPVTINLAAGQVTFIQLLLLSWAVVGLRNGRGVLAGILIGLAMLIKPLFGPVLLLLAIQRAWRPLVAAVAVGGIGLGAALLAVGWTEWSAYFVHALPTNHAVFGSAPGNLSLWRAGPWLAFGLLGASLLVLRRQPVWHSTAMMAAISVMVNPVVWLHYAPLLLLPLAAALRRTGLLIPGKDQARADHQGTALTVGQAAHATST